MPTKPLLDAGDNLIDQFARDLDKVLTELEKRVTEMVETLVFVPGEQFDAAVLLNSRAEMLQALTDAGYYALAQKHIAAYPDIIDKIRAVFDAAKLPPPKFTTADAQLFANLAAADLDQFAVVGEKAMDDLRLGLFRQAVAMSDFNLFVEMIAAATVGLDGRGSPLKNYAYTYANTAILKFQGDALIKAGESIGAESWRVVGPLDGVTRDECKQALRDPVRTAEQWQAAGYWGGTPGGWNCRHQLFPELV